jgi:hypothetical protein
LTGQVSSPQDDTVPAEHIEKTEGAKTSGKAEKMVPAKKPATTKK